MFDGTQVNLLIALLAGFVTFFASCLLPLVPTYLAYLSGISLKNETSSQERWQVFNMGALFVSGFVLTFILLGLATNQLSTLITPYKKLVTKLAGLLFIALGLFMLGIFQSKLFAQQRHLKIRAQLQQHRSLYAFLTGVGFGFGWTPCIGPVLALILFWSAQAESALKGIALLTAYGIGLGIPFLLIALFFEKLIPFLKKYSRVSQLVTLLSGVVVTAIGVLLLLDQFNNFSLMPMRWLNMSPFSI